MKNMNFLKNIKIERPVVKQLIFWVIAVALGIGGFFSSAELPLAGRLRPYPERHRRIVAR